MTGFPPAFQGGSHFRLGLDPEMTTVLVVAGGFGMGPLESLFRSVCEIRRPVQIVVICGKNAALERRLSATTTCTHAVRVVGYTTEMDIWMSAADLLVGKAGGLTSSEALARGVILVVVNPIPGNEERNSDYFLEEGAAIRCNNLPALPYKIDTLLCDRERLARMRAAVNLVRNAVEAAPVASEVEVAARTSDGEAVIEVRDRGAGLAPDARSSLFRPFFTTKEKGTGLGLALAKKVADAHGGTLALDERAGGGTVARLAVPAALAAARPRTRESRA